MSIVFLSQLPDAEAQLWLSVLQAAAPDESFVAGPPHARLDERTRTSVDIAVVANPQRGLLASLPNLRLIQSAWAGVDGLLADPTVPAHAQIARLVDPGLARAMAEAVLAHVMALHRQAPQYGEQQRRHEWRKRPQPLASQRCVGVLGLGAIGAACALALTGVGFQVLGWNRRGTVVERVETFSGEHGFMQLMSRAEIVVNILPLTRETRGILNTRAFALMRPGSALVNVGRGGHVVERDLLDALTRGQLGHAVLDVFDEEPLPPRHVYWSHPAITVLPHVAAITDPNTAAPCIASNIRRFRASLPLEGEVSRKAGY